MKKFAPPLEKILGAPLEAGTKSRAFWTLQILLNARESRGFIKAACDVQCVYDTLSTYKFRI